MTDQVPGDEIEGLVGAERHPTRHIAKADSESEIVYILHSQECLDEHADLRHCSYSRALDKGIRFERWRWAQDFPLFVMIDRGRLVPDDS